MANYILHIGYGKTGTTALQRFLAANRSQLMERGIVYPDAKVNGSWLDTPDHNMVARALTGQLGWWNLTPEEYFRQFEKQRQDADADTVILSGESFMGFLQPWSFDSPEAYWKALADLATRIAELLKGHEVVVVAYLRRQDEWVDSAINQMIKFGALMDDDSALWSTETLLEKYAPRLDYACCLDVWAKAFGDHALKIGVYEPKTFREGGIVTEFLALTGINDDGLVHPPMNNEDSNIRLNRDVLELKRILNLVRRPKYEERVLVAGLRNISQALGSVGQDWPLLSGQQKIDLMKQYQDANAVVARRYLGRDDGVLFEQPAALSNEDAYPGLSVETALEILMRVDRYMATPAARAQLFRHWVAEKLRIHAPILHSFARVARKLTLGAVKQ